MKLIMVETVTYIMVCMLCVVRLGVFDRRFEYRSSSAVYRFKTAFTKFLFVKLSRSPWKLRRVKSPNPITIGMRSTGGSK